jgi:hypothetical protein
MRDNRSNYLIKTVDKAPTDKFEKNELFNVLKSSALLSGLESISNSKSTEKAIKPIGKWSFPKKFAKIAQDKLDSIRKHLEIRVSEDESVPLINNFRDMRFPEPILKALKKMKIEYPTPVQMQGIPIV